MDPSPDCTSWPFRITSRLARFESAPVSRQSADPRRPTHRSDWVRRWRHERNFGRRDDPRPRLASRPRPTLRVPGGSWVRPARVDRRLDVRGCDRLLRDGHGRVGWDRHERYPTISIARRHAPDPRDEPYWSGADLTAILDVRSPADRDWSKTRDFDRRRYACYRTDPRRAPVRCGFAKNASRTYDQTARSGRFRIRSTLVHPRCASVSDVGGWSVDQASSSRGNRLIRARTGAVAIVDGRSGSAPSSPRPPAATATGMNRHSRLRTPGK